MARGQHVDALRSEFDGVGDRRVLLATPPSMRVRSSHETGERTPGMAALARIASRTGPRERRSSWAGHYVDEIKQLMGHDYWPYGVELNRKTLETFLRYCQEQGLSNRNMEVDELFAHETLEVYHV